MPPSCCHSPMNELARQPSRLEGQGSVLAGAGQWTSNEPRRVSQGELSQSAVGARKLFPDTAPHTSPGSTGPPAPWTAPGSPVVRQGQPPPPPAAAPAAAAAAAAQPPAAPTAGSRKTSPGSCSCTNHTGPAARDRADGTPPPRNHLVGRPSPSKSHSDSGGSRLCWCSQPSAATLPSAAAFNACVALSNPGTGTGIPHSESWTPGNGKV